MAYKIEFEIRTAIPTLQNTFDSGFFWVGWWWWGGECQRIKVLRSRVYPLGQLPTINKEINKINIQFRSDTNLKSSLILWIYLFIWKRFLCSSGLLIFKLLLYTVYTRKIFGKEALFFSAIITWKKEELLFSKKVP